MNTRFLLLTALIAASTVSGCGIYRAQSLTPAKYYYLTADQALISAGRVDIIEFVNETDHPDISAETTRTIFQALQKEQIFGLRVFSLDDPVWRSLQLEPASTYSLEQLKSMRDTLGSDAVITGAVTNYRPFPHMSMSLRLAMIDLRDGKLLWAVDHTWDTADKQTQERIKQYFKSQVRSGYAPLSEDLVTVSPIEFNKFVAYEVVRTLNAVK